MHPVGLCQRVSSSRVKVITKVRKARWLSVALKVIVGTLVLPKIAKSIFLCESHFNAQWLSTDHQKCYSLFQAFSKWNESNRHVMVNGAKLATERKLREGLVGDLTKTSLGLAPQLQSRRLLSRFVLRTEQSGTDWKWKELSNSSFQKILVCFWLKIIFGTYFADAAMSVKIQFIIFELVSFRLAKIRWRRMEL